MRTINYLILCILCFSAFSFAQKKEQLEIPICYQTTELLNIDLDVTFSEQKENKRVTIIHSEIENKYIQFVEDGEDRFQTKVNFYGKISNISGTKSGTFGSEMSHSFNESDYQRVKAEKTEFEKKILLSPGYYKVDLYIFDDNSKWCGKKTNVFNVSKNEEQKIIQK